MKERLTASMLRNARPTGVREQRTGAGRGLYLEYGAETLTWLFRYDSPETNKRSWMSLGPAACAAHGGMTLSEARARTEAMRAEVDRGVDPAHERERAIANAPPTFEAIASEWDAGRVGRRAEGTRTKDMGRLRLYVLPVLGDRIITTIKASDLQMVLDRVPKSKEETAHRTYTAIRQVCDYAESRDLLPGKNPATALRRMYPAAKQTPIPAVSGEHEIGRLVCAIEEYNGTPAVRSMLKLGLLFFVRPGKELRHAQWSEFDFEACEWNVPDARMKKRRAHVVPLAPQAVAVLREQRLWVPAHSPFVFPGRGRGGKRPLSVNALNVALNALGYGRDSEQCQRAHSFRALASTHLNMMAARDPNIGFDERHIELQLAHQARNRVAAAYNRNDFIEQRRTLMSVWASEVYRMRDAARAASP